MLLLQEDGKTALYIAVETGNDAMTYELLRQKANPNIKRTVSLLRVLPVSHAPFHY